MSRSRKRYPAGGNCGGSDKFSKQKASRRLRRLTKTVISQAVDLDSIDLPLPLEVTSNYLFHKDGHRWYGDEVVGEFPSMIRK